MAMLYFYRTLKHVLRRKKRFSFHDEYMSMASFWQLDSLFVSNVASLFRNELRVNPDIWITWCYYILLDASDTKIFHSISLTLFCNLLSLLMHSN